MSLSSGGAGGGDSTDSTSDTAKGDAVDTVESSDTSGGDGITRAEIVAIITGLLPWWVLNPPDILVAFVRPPYGDVIATLAVKWLYQRLLLPVIQQILSAAALLVNTILFLGDTVAVLTAQVIGLIVTGGAAVGVPLLRGVNQFNRTLATEVATQFGLAAPPMVFTLVTIEVLGVAWGLWTVLQVIDVPGIDLGGTLSAVTLPFRRILGLFR